MILPHASPSCCPRICTKIKSRGTFSGTTDKELHGGYVQPRPSDAGSPSAGPCCKHGSPEALLPKAPAGSAEASGGAGAGAAGPAMERAAVLPDQDEGRGLLGSWDKQR